MPGTPRFGRRDALALLSLALTATVIAWPILRGGYLTYIDNSVHLAEIYELSRPGQNGWSELGFAGLPIDTLHSPIFYPALAFLTRNGVPLEPMYVALLWTGFFAPSAALYWVARRRASIPAALFVSYLVLVQPSAVWGIGSPLAGMWTLGIATALLLLLVDLLARPRLTTHQHLAASLLLAVAVLTHLFVLPLITLVAGITTYLHSRDGTLTRTELHRRVAGWALAALASAKYWLTLMWVSEVSAAPQPAFRPEDILARLFLPCEPLYLLDARIAEGVRHDLLLTDVLPSVLPVVLGVIGYLKWRNKDDRLGETGFWLGVLILASLLVHRYVPLKFLGPVSWRLIDWARLGFALSAIGPLSSPRFERAAERGFAAAIVGLPLLGFWWGRPLARDNAETLKDEMRPVRELWAWLAGNAKKDWGRLYLEDAFGWAWNDGGLAQSHVLVLTRRQVGLPQMGAYYGVVPYRLRWTLSEFNSLYSTRGPSKDWILEAMGKTNVGAIVTANRDMEDAIAATGAFDLLHRVPPYAVFRLHDGEDKIISELTPSNHVSEVDARPGDIRLKIVSDYSRSRILAKVAFHPWWHVEGGAGSWLRESPEGFLVVDDVPQGESRLHLWYEPSHIPATITSVGFLGESGWALALGLMALRRRRAMQVQSA